MSKVDVETLLEAVATAAADWHDNRDRDRFVAALRPLPSEVRALLAVVALAAAHRPLSQSAVATAAGLSRGSAYAKKRDEMDLLHTAASGLAAGLLDAQRDGPTVADLAEQLQRRDQEIARLRQQLGAARHDRDLVLAYARRLHEQLRPEYEENLRTRKERVRDITPRLRPVDDGPPGFDPE